MGFVKWLDKAPIWLKIVLALPVLDVVWAIYRIIKGACTGKLLTLVAGILWILLGWAILWVIDLICIILYKKPTLFA